MFLEGGSNSMGRYALLPGCLLTHDPFVIVRAAQMAAYTNLAIIMALKPAVTARLRLQLRRSPGLGIAIAEWRGITIGRGGH